MEMLADPLLGRSALAQGCVALCERIENHAARLEESTRMDLYTMARRRRELVSPASAACPRA